jgi:diguanylate cyclase (GGDEF)-like protein/PAS domain S-box-containing protein
VAQEDLRAILNALPAMVGYWDRDLRNRMGNEAYVEYFGVSPEQLPGMHIRDVLGPALYEQNLPYMRRALAGEEQLFDRAIVDPTGAVRYTQASYIPDMVDGHARGFFVLVTDITARRTAEKALAAAEQRFRSLFDRAPLGMFLLSQDGVVLDANAAAVELLGRPRQELVGSTTTDFTHPDDVAVSQDRRRALAAGEVESYTLEKRYVRGDGDIVWAQLDARLLQDGEDGEALILGQVQDITEQRFQRAELERLANHDALTGLLNRRGLLNELERDCARMRRYGDGAALVIVDLDHFKDVNDAFGHEAGDAALQAVGRLLTARLRETDRVARHGGDEFAVILPRTTAAAAERVAQTLVDRVRAAQLGVPGRPISASAGVAVLRPEDTATSVLARADLAMYLVKGRGGDAVAAPA